MRIGLIGFGTIGQEVARAISEGRAGDTTLVRILEVDPRYKDDRITPDADEFFSSDMDVVVEAAGHAALKQHAVRALTSGRDMLAVSVGAFSDDEFRASIQRATEASNRRFQVPSGSLGGLDAISAGAFGPIDDVTLIVRKPPAAWKGTPAEAVASRATDEPICFYEGKAREATKAYPQNVNVLAALSLAGIGFDQTNVKMYVDPTVKYNTFELAASGEFGEIKVELKNRPYPQNPKTGHLVVLSLVKAINRLQQKFIVGF
jgi:aspartate dehydrogenase